MTPQTGPEATQGHETTDVVARAREALENVTEGPWRQNGNNGVHTQRGHCVALTYGDNTRLGGSKADATFVAAARALVPELIAEVERLHSLPTTKDQQ